MSLNSLRIPKSDGMLRHRGDDHHRGPRRRSPRHDGQCLCLRVARSDAGAGLRRSYHADPCPSARRRSASGSMCYARISGRFRSTTRGPSARHENAEAEAGARFDRTRHGTPVLHGSLAYLECRLHSAEVAGDHTIFIAEVEDVVVREGEPLLFFRGKYRKVGEDVEK